jgi:hypothetical protein
MRVGESLGESFYNVLGYRVHKTVYNIVENRTSKVVWESVTNLTLSPVLSSTPDSDDIGKKSAKKLIVPTFDGKIVQPKIKKS